jgi:hypothetical protein
MPEPSNHNLKALDQCQTSKPNFIYVTSAVNSLVPSNQIGYKTFTVTLLYNEIQSTLNKRCILF